MPPAVAVTGLRDLQRALAKADRDTRLGVRRELRQVGDVVRADAVVRMSAVDSHSAAGYRTRVRQRGIAVEQSIRKTTGRRPDYGALQMRRALLPALYAKADDTERALERALDVVCERFNRGAPL